jgi:predicted amidohydrolase YtcJ
LRLPASDKPSAAPAAVVVTGRLRPLDQGGAIADWMLLRGPSIAAIGRGPIPDELPAGIDRLDLSPRTIIPALHDAHVHLLGTGLMEVDLDLGGASSLDEALDLLAERARTSAGTLLRAHSFDPDLMPDGRYPTVGELDSISETIPIYVRRRDGHSSAANSAALRLFSLPGDTPGIEIAAGRPTGVLRGLAHTSAANRVGDLLSDEERVQCYRRAAARAAARGIGVVHALVGKRGPGDRDVELLLAVAHELPVDVVVYAQTEDLDRVAALGLPRIGGCLLLDGSLGSGTAALSAPYADRDGRGTLYYSDDRLTGFFRAAHARGFQIAVHALGERAIGQAVACLEAACGADARDARHRIEHCELPSPAHIATMARLGIAAGVQPAFELFWGGPGGMYEKRLGPARARKTNPFRTMLDAGLTLGGGSDSYVTPMDSLLGIHAAVNRSNESERLSVLQAVSLFTSGASRLSFDEARRGTLEVGKEASFTVLERDPFDVAPAEIKDIRVAGLFVRGRRVAGPQEEREAPVVKKTE